MVHLLSKKLISRVLFGYTVYELRKGPEGDT